MEGYGLYEDLSLFNGDLLLEPLSNETPQQQQVKDVGISIFEAPKASSVLAHPQYGSGELGLADLLASPTKDLPDPFAPNSSWMDTNMDLLDLLTDETVKTEAPIMLPVPQQESQATEYASSLQVFQELFTDMTSEPEMTVNDNLPVSESIVTVDEELPQVTNADIDILEEISEAGLQDLLSSSVRDALIFDAPILSPVSAEDIDSLLSSNPPSPSSSNSFNQSSDGISLAEDTSYEEYSPEPQKQRSAPYTKGRRRNIDRKERKKEQNRTAALKYRQKKRNEMGGVQQECEELESRNQELRDKVDSMTREINYLKDLMAEVNKVRAKSKKRSS